MTHSGSQAPPAKPEGGGTTQGKLSVMVNKMIDIKNILISVGLISLLISVCGATDVTYRYSEDGYGTFGYSYQSPCAPDETNLEKLIYIPDTGAARTVYYDIAYIGSYVPPNNTDVAISFSYYQPGSTTIHSSGLDYSNPLYVHWQDSIYVWNSASYSLQCKLWAHPNDYGTCGASGGVVFSIQDTPIINYEVSGDVGCCDDTILYMLTSSGYQAINSTVDDNYNFPVIDTKTYKLVFYPDLHSYIFTVDGGDINYDHNICSYITMNFYDRCETPVKNLQLFYWTTTYPTVMSTTVDGSMWKELVFGCDVEIGDTVYIIPIWYGGTQKYTFIASETPMQMDITNIPITYEMGVKTVTDVGAPISGVQVSISQSCAYDGTKNKVTSGGWAWFTGCSNTGGSLTVSKSGYKSATMPFPTLMATAWNYRTSYIITMESDGSANDTSGDFNDTIIDISEVVTPDAEYDLDDNNEGLHDGVEIWFTNENGNRCTKISDTDTYVDLWFINKNSNASSMTLEFQQSYTGNYYWENLNWTIAYKKFGFKRIYNVNFTPYYYYYRAKIYNDELLPWDRIRNLDVRNETKEEEKHYENLSTCLWFRHATVDHKIDYRNDIEIVCNGASNNTTLLNLDIELYNGSVLVDYINLTWADFSGASIKWFYIWKPTYDYASGHNYTTKMIGHDGYVLRTDHVDCFTDDRKNKLTIKVKDRIGATLDNCYIYLEDWGLLPTGSTYYNAYEGIDNGYYRYKASKSGYSGTGWADVTLSDNDKIVWYTLTEDYTNTSATQQKLTDDDIKGIFFPLMFFLLICLIFGGFKYVSQ